MTDKNTELLNEIHEIASKCDRCGNCLLVCPVFAVNSREACGARGMVNAARALTNGAVAAEADILTTVDYCLLCGACTDVCASKVKVTDVMLKTRQKLVHLSNKPFDHSTDEKEKMNKAFDALCDRCAEIEGPEIENERKVAYFFGCQARLDAIDTAVKTVELLSRVAEVELINNECCGLPALTRGHTELFIEYAKQNIQLFEDVDTIVSDCACCSDTLKKIASYLANDPEWSERAAAFSKKVLALSEYLTKIGYMPEKHKEQITYHDPCHLGRNQGIKKEPRELLKTAGDYVEMSGADVCCGGPCFFPSDYPETSDTLLDKKCLNIEKSGAAIVTTECFNCLRQLKRAAEKSGGKFKALHISEIL